MTNFSEFGPTAMDNRYDEGALRNEVIYLHSLWHQGPPLNPNPTPLSNRSGILHFTNPTTSFKKKAKNRTRLDSGIEWPVVEIIQDLPSSGWREFKPKPKPDPPVKPMSDEEQARLNSLQMQQRVLETCRWFFADEEDDEDEDEEDDDEDDMVDGDGIEGSKEYKFLVGIFMEDKELRSYYECHHENGEFFCLVCCGIGNKAPKKFKGGIALVQHSISVLKTRQTRAHRAFGQVVCKVLGIDTNRLPVIIFNGEPLGRSLGSSQEKQCNVNKENEGSCTNFNADNGKAVEETSLPVASGEVQYMPPENVDGTHDLQLVPRDAFVAVEGNDDLMTDEDSGQDVAMDQQTAADNIGVHSQSYRQGACCANQGTSTSKLFENMNGNIGFQSVHKKACSVDQMNDKLMACEDNQEHVVMHNRQTNSDSKDGQSASCIKEVCCAYEENSVLQSFELGICGGCAMPSSDSSTRGVGSQPDLQEDIDAQQKLIVVKEMRKCNLGDG